MVNNFFDRDFIKKLENLSLIARRMHRGSRRGEHPSYKKGSSLEFFDYRAYQPGDDFRYIDWNIWERLNKILLKLYEAEEDLTIHILVDTSKSMGFGSPSKIDYAKRVGAALGYIGITNFERVGVTAFRKQIIHSLPPIGRQRTRTLFDYLANLKADGETDFNNSLMEYSKRSKRPGLAIIISDLLDSKGYRDGLLSLLYNKFDVMLIQILTEEEFTPGLEGETKLIDSETGKIETITINKTIMNRYRIRIKSFLDDIEKFCLKKGVEYLRTSTSVPFEDLVLKYLRQGMYLH